MFRQLRLSIALWIAPELRQGVSTAICQATSRDTLLLALADRFKAATALSDWEIAARAAVNNRAILLLRDGRTVSPHTARRLLEFFRTNWPAGELWPVSEDEQQTIGKVLVIPAIEKLGGPQAVLNLIHASGRMRTLDAVKTWSRRNGVPHYARRLMEKEAKRQRISLDEADFVPVLDFPRPTPKKEAA